MLDMNLLPNNLPLPAALIAVCSIILMAPIDDEKRSLSIVCAIATATSAVALPLAGVPQKMACGAVMLCLCVYLVSRIYRRYLLECKGKSRTTKALRIKNEARAFYSCVTFVCGCLYLTIVPEVPEWIIDIVVGAFALLLLLRVITGWVLFVPVKDHRSGASALVEMGARAEYYENIYKKAVAFMEEHKPYITSSLHVDKLAAMIGVSRTDLSRAINLNTNGNYSQFVNSFRVPAAENLMTRDPNMKVTEAGRLSGFQSESSFTSVFKQYKGDTPSTFMRHLRYLRRKTT